MLYTIEKIHLKSNLQLNPKILQSAYQRSWVGKECLRLKRRIYVVFDVNRYIVRSVGKWDGWVVLL